METVRYMQYSYADGWAANPVHSQTEVISGKQARIMIENEVGAAIWSTSNGEKIEATLDQVGAKAFLYQIVGAPDAIIVPSPEWGPAFIFELGATSSCDDVVLRIGKIPSSVNATCYCILGCSGACQGCPGYKDPFITQEFSLDPEPLDIYFVGQVLEDLWQPQQ